MPSEPLDPRARARRRLLRGGLALPAALGLRALRQDGSTEPQDPTEEPAPEAPPEPAAPRTPAEEREAFYRRWIPRARSLARDVSPDAARAEESFLWELGADLAGRPVSFFPERSFTAYEAEGMTVGPIGRDDTFQLVEYVLAPGALVQAHNHVAYAFLTLCVEGEARAVHYEPEPSAPDARTLEEDFLVRRVADVLLRPGRFSTLTRTRANVHALRAGDAGARLLDFGVHFRSRGDGPLAFSVLEVDPEPADRARETYTARWIGNVYAKGYERKRKE